jgi:hypothetical protein
MVSSINNPHFPKTDPDGYRYTNLIVLLHKIKLQYFNVLSGHPCCVVKGIDILKLKNCLYTTIIYLDVKGRLLHVSACGHLQVGSLNF